MPIDGTSETRAPRIRLGMVGGGRDAFIGGVHRIASRIDDEYELVAGCFSSTPEKSQASGRDLGLDPTRVYDSFADMAKREARLKNGIDAVAIVTPNHMHYPVAREFLKRGIHVICDKPLTASLTEAKRMVQAAESSGALFVLTHNYTGYPMVRQAREMVASGELGEIRVVNVEYAQDWLTEDLESTGQKQAGWRTDPARSGAGGSTGDIGTHAYNLGRYMTGLLPATIAANLKVFVPDRPLDDYGHAVIRYQNGALGTVTASQISHGRENDLRIQIDGTLGSLEWHQEEPNKMLVRHNGKPHYLYTRDPNASFSNEAGKAACRLPAGHPEAFFEAFANVYRAGFDALALALTGQPFERVDTIYPNVRDGVEGMYFIEQSVASSKADGAWLPLAHPLARR